jgi:hypothetical protein
MRRRGLLLGAAGVGVSAAVGVLAGRLAGGGDDPGPGRDRAAPGAGPPGNLVSMFGAPGSFGEPAGGANVETVAVPGWGFGPGHAAFMSAVASDGTVFLATTPFSDDQSKLTGTTMELGVFEPDARRFTRVVIPSSTGRSSQPRADPAYHGIGGGDVGDVIVVTAGDGGERVVFCSAMPYYGWDVAVYGLLPAFGQLRRGAGDGGWRYDRASSRTTADLAVRASPRTADAAFPVVQTGMPRSARGPASLARLPRSGHIVIAQYFGTGTAGGGGAGGGAGTGAGTGGAGPAGVERTDSGALLVVDLDGRVRAFWQYPPVRPLGMEVVVNPREVVADPTGEPDDERFVLISDCRGLDYAPVPFPVQEFSYSASRRTITPMSTAVRAAQDFSRMETACFDAHGTLFVARTRADGLLADAMAVYPKLGRERGLVTRTPAAGNWPVDSWGSTNRPDHLVAGTGRGGLVRSICHDPLSGAVVTAGLDGLVQVVRPSGSGPRMTFRVSRGVDVGLNMLRGPATRYVGLRRGSVDAVRRILWLPVNQLVLDGLVWPYPPFKLDQWLLRVNLDRLLDT